ncbi:hypothetical protein DY000_02004379 [Brassica cretica]|uniref:Uncharacterized protein n=1 Tax=Brassica cretica TaxID=69181 RepID=A0ABQ7C211_BRACR|nr:hypothetical protein DY000_02004379 [Brassica cretica]
MGNLMISLNLESLGKKAWCLGTSRKLGVNEDPLNPMLAGVGKDEGKLFWTVGCVKPWIIYTVLTEHIFWLVLRLAEWYIRLAPGSGVVSVPISVEPTNDSSNM